VGDAIAGVPNGGAMHMDEQNAIAIIEYRTDTEFGIIEALRVIRTGLTCRGPLGEPLASRRGRLKPPLQILEIIVYQLSALFQSMTAVVLATFVKMLSDRLDQCSVKIALQDFLLAREFICPDIYHQVVIVFLE